jgi:hypothetical protein
LWLNGFKQRYAAFESVDKLVKKASLKGAWVAILMLLV